MAIRIGGRTSKRSKTIYAASCATPIGARRPFASMVARETWSRFSRPHWLSWRPHRGYRSAVLFPALRCHWRGGRIECAWTVRKYHSLHLPRVCGANFGRTGVVVSTASRSRATDRRRAWLRESRESFLFGVFSFLALRRSPGVDRGFDLELFEHKTR